MSAYEGRCHCGTMTYAYDTDVPISSETVRSCSCNFCTKAGPLWTSEPGAKITIRAPDAVSVTCYRFGSGTADFLSCARCGTLVVATTDIDGRKYAIVNARTLPIKSELRATSLHDLDGEKLVARLARRARNWIGDVTFEFSEI